MIIGETLIACAQQSPNDLKQIFALWNDFLVALSDSLSQTRIDWLLDGTGQEFGLLQLIENNHDSDSRRVYNMIKFLAQASASAPLMKDALNNRQEKWQWAVIWLQKQMEEHQQQNSPNSASANFSTCATKFVTSNEDSGPSRSFQRTVSAQKTLQTARDLLTEFDNGSGSGNGNENESGCNVLLSTAIQRISSPDSCVIEIGNPGSSPTAPAAPTSAACEDFDQRMDEES